MQATYKQYGDTVEITTWTKKTQGNKRVHVSNTFKRGFDYGIRRHDSLKRTKTECLRRVSTAIAEYGSPLLFTFTLKGDSSNVVFLSGEIRYCLLRLRVLYPKACAVIVPELSPKRRLHAHALIFGLPMHYNGVRNGRRVHISDGCVGCSFSKFWRAGFYDVVSTDGDYKLAGYLAKYVAKAHEEVILRGIRLLRFSKNFPRTLVIKNELALHLSNKYNLNMLPSVEWVRDTSFLGRVTRKYYKIK